MTISKQLASVHARAFTSTRPWSSAEFETLLASPYVFLCTDSTDTVHTSVQAFALGRVIVDEVELLTLVTDPSQRRRGFARTCLSQFEKTAINRGAATAYLEVAADNLAAIALYQNAGFKINARRAGYYNQKQGPPVDALVMSRNLAN